MTCDEAGCSVLRAMSSSPLVIIGEALWATVALLALVVGCASDGSWWSLLTAGCYLLALGVWVLFLPGCMPCVAAPGVNTSMSSGAGCCGGQLWSHWGAWLTSFLGASTFGLAFTLFHNETVSTVHSVQGAGSMLLTPVLCWLAADSNSQFRYQHDLGIHAHGARGVEGQASTNSSTTAIARLLQYYSRRSNDAETVE